MALVKCNECGNTLSKKAKICPHCGVKVKKSPSKSTQFLFLVILAIIILVNVYDPDNDKSKSVTWGVIRYTHTTTNVRESRSTLSKIVKKLKPNSKVKCDFLENNWWAVFNLKENIRDKSTALGYVHSSLLYPASSQKTKKSFSSKDLLKYQIVNKQDYSYLNASRMKYRVLLNVKKIPSKEEMKEVAKYLWGSNKSWDEFTVFLYLPDMNVNDLAFGAATFTPKGLKEFFVQNEALYGTKWKN